MVSVISKLLLLFQNKTPFRWQQPLVNPFNEKSEGCSLSFTICGSR